MLLPWYGWGRNLREVGFAGSSFKHPRTFPESEIRGRQPQNRTARGGRVGLQCPLRPVFRPRPGDMPSECILVWTPSTWLAFTSLHLQPVVGASETHSTQLPPKPSKPWLWLGISAVGWMLYQKRTSYPCLAEKLIKFLSPSASIQFLYKGKAFNHLERFGIIGTFLLMGIK